MQCHEINTVLKVYYASHNIKHTYIKWGHGDKLVPTSQIIVLRYSKHAFNQTHKKYDTIHNILKLILVIIIWHSL